MQGPIAICMRMRPMQGPHSYLYENEDPCRVPIAICMRMRPMQGPHSYLYENETHAGSPFSHDTLVRLGLNKF